MSPVQLKKLQELSQAFSNGRATPEQIQQLSVLLAQINGNTETKLTLIDAVNVNTSGHLVNY